jgi:hypothetical protein
MPEAHVPSQTEVHHWADGLVHACLRVFGVGTAFFAQPSPFTNKMFNTQAKMRLSCSARSSSSCLVRSFQRIFQQQRSTFVPSSQQHQSSSLTVAATRPGQQQQLAGSRSQLFSSTPRFVVRSGDGEGATDSMESKCTTLSRQQLGRSAPA